MPLTLKHQTAAEFVARFRATYRDSSKERVARLAKWVLDRIVAGDLTDTQVRTAFGLTSPQWTTKKTAMQALVDKWLAIETAVGD